MLVIDIKILHSRETALLGERFRVRVTTPHGTRDETWNRSSLDDMIQFVQKQASAAVQTARLQPRIRRKKRTKKS